jgi:hypothetical protein
VSYVNEFTIALFAIPIVVAFFGAEALARIVLLQLLIVLSLIATVYVGAGRNVYLDKEGIIFGAVILFGPGIAGADRCPECGTAQESISG